MSRVVAAYAWLMAHPAGIVPIIGSQQAERIAEAVATNVVGAGVDGVILNLPAYVPGSITKVGEALRPVLGL